MASKKIYDAIGAGDWNKVKELIMNTSWTLQDLETKHGVHTELFLIRLILDKFGIQIVFKYLFIFYPSFFLS